MNHKSALIFLHVPKTAGVTMKLILERLYPGCKYSLYNSTQFTSLPDLFRKQGDQFDLIQGHFAYGAHRYLRRPANYITLLRDPVERTVSLYYFVLRARDHWLHKEFIANNVSLAEFVDGTLTGEPFNLQSRLIAGGTPNTPGEFHGAAELSLGQAKRRLENNFCAFGLTEKFDASLVMISQALGWPLFSKAMLYDKQNVTKGRRKLSQISPHILDKIRKNNALDVELYEFACKLFEQRMQADPGFQIRLRLYILLRKYLKPLAQKIVSRAAQ